MEVVTDAPRYSIGTFVWKIHIHDPNIYHHRLMLLWSGWYLTYPYKLWYT